MTTRFPPPAKFKAEVSVTRKAHAPAHPELVEGERAGEPLP